jgi:hypothetical protein
VIVDCHALAQLEDPVGVHTSGVDDGEEGGEGEARRGDEADSVVGMDKVEEGDGHAAEEDGEVGPLRGLEVSTQTGRTDATRDVRDVRDVRDSP